MVLQGEANIREVIPFPKTQTGFDPLTGSPGAVDDAQLARARDQACPAAGPKPGSGRMNA